MWVPATTVAAYGRVPLASNRGSYSSVVMPVFCEGAHLPDLPSRCPQIYGAVQPAI